jgi:hypothetical protein
MLARGMDSHAFPSFSIRAAEAPHRRQRQFSGRVGGDQPIEMMPAVGFLVPQDDCGKRVNG